MAYVRRHWLSSVLYVTIIALGLVAFLIPTLSSQDAIETAQAQTTEPQPVDPHLYTRVQKLRQELSLTNQDLAAMGHTKESATALLESLKSWCSTNKAALDQNHRNELRARAALRETIRKISVGPSPGSIPDTRLSVSLSSLQQELAALYQQRKTLIDGAVAQLEVRMDAYQLKTWQSARANVGLPTQLRYVPDLTDPQRQAIHTRLTDRSSADSLNAVLDAELTWNQKQALDSTRVNTAVRAKEVRNAEADVLPLPDVLREHN